MTRQILAVCRSVKRQRPAVDRILDRYFMNDGDRTWSGYASNACLKRVSDELKGISSRKVRVSVSELHLDEGHSSPLFSIGACPAESGGAWSGYPHSRAKGTSLTKPQIALRGVVGIAALFHDIGKGTKQFQEKLRLSMEDGEPRADPVRHEVFSAFLFDAFSSAYADDDTFLDQCLNIDTEALGAAAETARKSCMDLYEQTYADGSDAQLKFLLDGCSDDAARQAILSLILTHHRLPYSEGDSFALRSGRHVKKPKDAPRVLEEDSMALLPGASIWAGQAWQDRLKREALRIQEALPCEIPDIAIYGRTALLLSDHIGSSKSQPGSGLGVLANTFRPAPGRKKVPADSLELHTEKVYRATRQASDVVYGKGAWNFPALKEEDCPEVILSPKREIPAFAWQAEVAEKAAQLVANSEGGFLGLLLAKTGAGKTQAAPALMAAATFSDPDKERRGLRFNLGLGLRSLASQSGRDYVDDIGFSSEDVVTLIGGVKIPWDENFDQAGSEDRIAPLADQEALHPDEDVPLDGEECSTWLRRLGKDADRGLPDIVEDLVKESGSLQKMLETPILSATIDHLMPAADASKGFHLGSMLRVLSADMIIDEIDQFSEEDLSAIMRLVYIVGAGGRRLIVMSATMPEDIAEQVYEAYSAGWRSYASMTGKSDKVNLICAGDTPASVSTSAGNADFASVFKSTVQQVLEDNAQHPSLRRGKVLSDCSSMEEVAEAVSKACDDLHKDNCFLVDDMRVSVGLLRITRIAHLRELARSLGGGEGILRKFVFLHANMPLLQRQVLERQLKSALTRKGASPNSRIEVLLRKEGVLQEAQDRGYSDVSVIVLSSPVIETGNDLDFDWVVADPSSLRSIVQTAGRGNRHRKIAIDAPNVALLPRYLVSLLEGGLVEKPGVETAPHPDTGVSRVHLDGGRDLVGSFVKSAEDLDVVDASLLLDPSKESPLIAAEKELRRRFFAGFPSVGSFLTNSSARMSAEYAKRRKFRRRSAPSHEVCPVFDGEGVSEWVHRDGRGRDVSIQIEDVDEFAHVEKLFSEGLPEMMGRLNLPQGLISYGQMSLNRDDLTGLRLDRHMGYWFSDEAS